MYRQRLDWRAIHEVLCKFPFSMVLASASLFYGLGVRARLQLYSRGVIRQKRLPGFVLSVGNITVGGTGKTPTVIMLARWAKEQGYSACVLSRGYKGKYSERVVEVSDGTNVKVPWQACGDEPYLLAQKLKGIPVVVSRSRYAAGMYAAQEFGSNFFILDDGFQHLDLARDFDLVLINSMDPFGNGHLLPWGTLREPIFRIERANSVLITHSDQNSDKISNLISCLSKFGHFPIFESKHQPRKIVFPNISEDFTPDWARGKQVVAFAAIGRPDGFKHTLRGLGFKIKHFFPFPDHHAYSKEEISKIAKIADQENAECMITTEKDWIKVEQIVDEGARVGYLEIEMTLGHRGSELQDLIRRAASG